MQKQEFCSGDECIIVELGQGAFHWDARENFKDKEVVFVKYDKSKLTREGFIACTLRLSEDICVDDKAQEYMLEGSTFYFPCVRLVKLEKATP